MTRCTVHPLDSLGDYRYVVIFSVFEGRLLFSRHKKRDTWETQGGHIEPGETPLQAARRELFEESGAVDFAIRPLFDYYAWDEEGSANGMVFVADIGKLGPLPESEMAETRQFDRLPQALTYPGITPVLYQSAAGLLPLSCG